MTFDYTLDYKTLDLRARPDLHRIGVGEQGVLLVEPYKSEILPHFIIANGQQVESDEVLLYMKDSSLVAGDQAVGFNAVLTSGVGTAAVRAAY